ncbi:MAG: ABC transporter permease [Psychroflexus sp.]|nr:ABC transporter permease [Psychroflexus sp.]
MLRLFNIEFYKFKRSKSAKVLSIIYFGLFAFIALFTSIRFDFGAVDFRVAEQGIFNFPYIWHFNAYFLAILKIFLAIVIVSLMSSEYTNRTLKQNLIDGLSKWEFIQSKFSMVVALSLVSTLVYFIISLILGLIFSDFTEPSIIFSDLEYVGAYFVKLIGFFSLCMFLGILVKRSAFALGFLFLVWVLEGLIRLGINFQAQSLDFLKQFLPLQSMSNLIVEPVTKLDAISSAANQLNPEFEKDYSVPVISVVTVLVWTAFFVFGSYKLLQKRDL